MIQVVKNFIKTKNQHSLDHQQSEQLKNEQENDKDKLASQRISSTFSIILKYSLCMLLALAIIFIAFQYYQHRQKKIQQLHQKDKTEKQLNTISKIDQDKNTDYNSKINQQKYAGYIHNATFPKNSSKDQFYTKISQKKLNTSSEETKHKNKGLVSPIIFPFNSVVESNTIYSTRGIKGVISNNCLERGRKRMGIVDLNLEESNQIVDEEREYYQSRYNTDKYEELPFCIVVPTFNNRENDRYLKNIKSIVMQEYLNFHIVVVDDASNDGTGQLIIDYLNTQRKVNQSRYTVIINQKQMFSTYNLRLAARKHCQPQQIFMIVDGDDQLLGRQVLRLFNAVFQQKELWFVYSNFIVNGQDIGFSLPMQIQVILKSQFRNSYFVTSHLRAYYTQLFLNIKEQDLKDDEGNYLRAAGDIAICIPILQQSHERIGYVPELTYIYDFNTGQNDNKLRLGQQKDSDQMIRNRPKYHRIETLFNEKQS